MTKPPKQSGSQSPTLLSIISHARAGALDRAWEMFVGAGFDIEVSDPRVLSVKGRLLKDRARRASGDEQQVGYAAAANAYAAAAEVDGSTYPLINAATLALLAGDILVARRRAEEVLKRIEDNPDEPETPFYKIATRAEAVLLLGREQQALDLLAEAIAVAPRAWEDHASTLRQFELILAQEGHGFSSLDPLRPARAIHYAGHIGIGGPQGELALRGEVDAWLAQENIGFAYGALAAGADIVIAEAVRAAGGELHVVLPSTIEAFAARSVIPFDDGSAQRSWEDRFNTLIDSAETIRTIASANALPGRLDIALSDSTAMGVAIMEARLLATSAAQVLVLSDEALASDQPGASALACQKWANLGLPQKTFTVQRESKKPSGTGSVSGNSGGDEGQIVAACLAVTTTGVEPGEKAEAIQNARSIADAFAQPVPPGWYGDHAVFCFAKLDDALKAGAALIEQGFAVAADLIATTPNFDPLHDGSRLPSADLAPLIGVAETLLGTNFHATETFAASAVVETGSRTQTQHISEIELAGVDNPVVVFSLAIG